MKDCYITKCVCKFTVLYFNHFYVDYEPPIVIDKTPHELNKELFKQSIYSLLLSLV
ncbi:UNVERIFIED_CONTAM: hypothetical protein FKN15_056995 [Acipenser sinensis]